MCLSGVYVALMLGTMPVCDRVRGDPQSNRCTAVKPKKHAKPVNRYTADILDR